MSLENHIKRLINEHKALDEEIDTLEHTGKYHDEVLISMKKQRLHLKDEIVRLTTINVSGLTAQQ